MSKEKQPVTPSLLADEDVAFWEMSSDICEEEQGSQAEPSSGRLPFKVTAILQPNYR